MRRIVATIADLHGGHWLGLCNPDTTFYDEDEEGNIVPSHPELKAVQKYLWERYETDRLDVENLAEGDDIILFVCGDLCNGTKYNEHMMRTRLSDQVEIGLMNLVPWVNMPNVRVVRIIVGTDVHNLGEGSLERIIAERLKDRYPEKDIKCVYHSLMSVDEVAFDVAHHGPGGGTRAWLRGNVARYYLRSAMLEDVLAGNTPPRIFQRAHYHVWVHEWLELNGYESDLVICPSYCALDGYSRKATRSTPYQTHGCVAYEIENGHLDKVHKLVKKLDLRTKERVGREW